MRHVEQNEAARVSDKAFAKEMWRHAEQDNVEAAKDVHQMWKYGRESDGYRKSKGVLSAHEIEALAEQHFERRRRPRRHTRLRSCCRALGLDKGLYPTARAAPGRRGKTLSPVLSRRVAYGLAIYNGAVRALAMGNVQGEVEPVTIVKSRREREIAQLERSVDADPMRHKFEAWAGPRQFNLWRHDDGFTNMVTAYACMGWLVNEEEQVKAKGRA